MSILLKGAKILIPKSSKHNTTADILIDDNGIISAIANDLSSDKAEIVDCAGKYLTLGWFDLRAHFSDPGEEHKEDLQTGLRLAEVSGFTDVAVLPNTKPVVQTKNDVAYIKGNSRHSVCHLHPIAAVTKDARGEELTEMMDLHHSGAVAFSDGHEPIWHTDILMKSLQYLQPFDGVLMNLAQDRWLAMFGTMHEGMASVQLGMKGVPSVAEEIAIQRDLSLLRYAGGKIHFSCVSSAGSVGLIRNAKKEGLDVTCDVAIYQLIYTDADINDYDTKYRVSPPLRSDLDKEALIQGVKDGTIDCIVSNHHPQDEECKKLEFDLSDNGMLAMQTFWPWLLQLNEDIPLEVSIPKITDAPRDILNFDRLELEVGHEACLTILDPTTLWTYDAKSNLSKSNNSPLLSQQLSGKVAAIIRGNQISRND